MKITALTFKCQVKLLIKYCVTKVLLISMLALCCVLITRNVNIEGCESLGPE